MKLLNRLFKRPETKTVVVNNQSDGINKPHVLHPAVHDALRNAELWQAEKRKVRDLKGKVKKLKDKAAYWYEQAHEMRAMDEGKEQHLELLIGVNNSIRSHFGIPDSMPNTDAVQSIKDFVHGLNADLKSANDGYHHLVKILCKIKEVASLGCSFDELPEAINERFKADAEFTQGLNRANARLEKEHDAMGGKVEFYEKLLTDICTELGYGTHFANHPMLPGMVKESVRTFQSDIEMWRKHRDNRQEVIEAIRAAVGAHESMNDDAVVEMVKENFETIETLTETNQRLCGRVDTLQAALNQAQAHMSKVWAHKEKGGRYRKLGEAIPAGVFADRDDQDYVAYQCLASGNVYIRLAADFTDKMHIIEDLSND